MSEPFPNSGRPQGLPPEAVPLEVASVAFQRELNDSKLLLVRPPLSLYKFSQVVNGLIVLEGAMRASEQHHTAAEVLALQLELVRELPFGPRTREQMVKNRQFCDLPPWPNPKS